MRLLLALSLVVLSSTPSAARAVDGARPAAVSRALVTPALLHAWHPSGTIAPAAGIRIDPEAGPPGGLTDLASTIAARRRALANVPVVRRPDGSRYAVVGGLVRGYTVARIQPDGSMIEDCVETETQARQLAAPTTERKR